MFEYIHYDGMSDVRHRIPTTKVQKISGKYLKMGILFNSLTYFLLFFLGLCAFWCIFAN